MRIYAEFTHLIAHLHTNWLVLYEFGTILMVMVRHYASTVLHMRTTKWLI